MVPVMILPNERTPHLQELIRFSTKATLVIPSLLLDEEIGDKFKQVRNALDYLKNDDALIVSQREVENDLIEITIEIKG